MLNLITLEKQEAELAKILTNITGMVVKVRLDPTLLPVIKSQYKSLGDHGDTLILDLSEDLLYIHAEDMLNRLAISWPTLFDLKHEYIALLVGLSNIFANTTIEQYIHSQGDSRCLQFPHVEWSVVKNDSILASNNVYSFIGSDYNYFNPAHFTVSYFGIEATGLSFSESVISPDWASVEGVIINRKPAARIQKKHSFFTASSFTHDNEGITELFSRVVSLRTKLAFFYSINDRRLVINNLSAKQNRGYRTTVEFDSFEVKNSILRVINPAKVSSEDLVSQVFLTDRLGYSKFSLLGLPNERTNTTVY